MIVSLLAMHGKNNRMHSKFRSEKKVESAPKPRPTTLLAKICSTCRLSLNPSFYNKKTKQKQDNAEN